ncbi:glutathione-S-transferas-like protein omega 1 [Trichodelitschia bisporula]|uniref:Glutathione-S-transferas-like protein omega 1 n=1 Tax=Trichodelitschia bisporula TaxID=703511 RepID=A0A6G1I648_9PEZI|nr:glutathione-S-transferas-like protein omega 1 [Trichodelitschia bisporula]
MAPKITLYTNHGCPYAHRAHITLRELGLEYEEVIIDLSTPREPWYLEVNPRGLVPSIKYSDGELKDEIITESAIVAQFLADLNPSHLLPASNASPTAALTRARINFFVDTWNTKIGSFMFALFRAADEGERQAKAAEWVAAVEKEIEPLLKDAGPFFGGAQKLTLAEVNIAPFLLRIFALSEAEVLPSSVKAGLLKLPNFARWSQATIKEPSVLFIWDEKAVVSRTAERIQKLKLQANGAAK